MDLCSKMKRSNSKNKIKKIKLNEKENINLSIIATEKFVFKKKRENLEKFKFTKKLYS